jgi:hypothetical protein
MPLGELQADIIEQGPDDKVEKSNHLCSFAEGKENRCSSRDTLASTDTLDRALDRAVAAPVFEESLEMLASLDMCSDLLSLNFEEAPLYRMPTGVSMPMDLTSKGSSSPSSSRGSPFPRPETLAEDHPRKLPASSEPYLLGACTINGPFGDCKWAQPRHTHRHVSAIGSPSSCITKRAAVKKSTPRTLGSQPWLCCGFTPLSV